MNKNSENIKGNTVNIIEEKNIKRGLRWTKTEKKKLKKMGGPGGGVQRGGPGGVMVEQIFSKKIVFLFRFTLFSTPRYAL